MAEILTHDNSVPAEVMESQASDEAESLAIGEKIVAEQEARLAGKYKTTEELESAYLELQKKLGNQEQQAAEQEQQPEDTDTDWLSEAYKSINESGELSDEIVKQISDMNGMDVFRAMQESIPDGRDLTESELTSVYSTVGGEEQYGNMIGWAKDNFSDAEIDAYDAVVETGNMAQINLALQALYYRYTDAMGQDGNLLQGKPASAQSTFRSQQELIAAMNDPRYDDDPAYRQDVLNKLDRSDISF